MRTMLLGVAVALLVAAGLGCQAGERGVNEPCALNTDCQGNLFCEARTCQPLPSCGDGKCNGGETTSTCCLDCACPAGQQCNPGVMQCRPATASCGDGRCDASERQVTSFCCADCCPPGSPSCPVTFCGAQTCAGRACLTSASCCDNFTCSRFGKTCQAARNLQLGEPCAQDAQCASGLCASYCTKGCSVTAQCGAANYCLATASGYACIPFCQNNADCAIYGNATCQAGEDPDGLPLKGCFAK